jgi:hypothetical protein
MELSEEGVVRGVAEPPRPNGVKDAGPCSGR